jgi:hypothetical protein
LALLTIVRLFYFQLTIREDSEKKQRQVEEEELREKTPEPKVEPLDKLSPRSNDRNGSSPEGE